MKESDSLRDEQLKGLLNENNTMVLDAGFDRKVMAHIHKMEAIKDKRRSWFFSIVALLLSLVLMFCISSCMVLPEILSKASFILSILLALFVLFQFNLLLTKNQYQKV